MIVSLSPRGHAEHTGSYWSYIIPVTPVVEISNEWTGICYELMQNSSARLFDKLNSSGSVGTLTMLLWTVGFIMDRAASIVSGIAC